MGRRVGLARMEVLIENLKRELQLNGSRLIGGKRGLRSTITDSRALTVEESGMMIPLNNSAGSSDLTITLPSPQVGLEYLFVLVANSGGANKILINAGTGNNIQGRKMEIPNGTGNITSGAHNGIQIGFGNSATRGDMLHLICRSSNRWVIVQSASSVAWVTS